VPETAREVVSNILAAFKELPDDADLKRVDAAAKLVAMTTYGYAYDGSRTRCDPAPLGYKDNPEWTPIDWSDEIKNLERFMEDGIRRHSFPLVNLDPVKLSSD
jgi:hypothetical protein